MNYGEWEVSVPEAITNDVLWKMKVYRMALFSCEFGWRDATKLIGDQTQSLADQLYRALGSISANIAEGYNRSSGKDSTLLRIRSWFRKRKSRLVLQIETYTLKYSHRSPY